MTRFQDTDKGKIISDELGISSLTSIKTKETVLEEDLIWNNLGKNSLCKNLTRILTFFFTVILALTIFLPINIIETLTPLYKFSENKSKKKAFI